MRRGGARAALARPVGHLLVLMAALVAAGCADRAGGPSPEEDRARLGERQNEFFAALQARDADRTAVLFADDAVLQVANMPPMEGQEGIRRFYANLFGFLSGSEAVPEATHLSRSGDLAYSVGATTNEFRGPDGPVSYSGKYVLVWRKVEADRRIAVYAISSDEAQEGR